MIGTQDVKTLFRAQEIIGRLSTESGASIPGLESAIDLARMRLESQIGRRRYLLEMLSDDVAYALPGLYGVFFVQLAEAGRFELRADLPVVTQIVALELVHDDRAIQVIHRSGLGFGDREYPL